MRKKGKENDSCCLFSEEEGGNLQRRLCHLQEVKRALGVLRLEHFHLDAAAVGQMVACGQIQPGNLSVACDDEEDRMQNKTCFPLENIASAC